MVPGLKEPLLDESAGERPPAFNPESVRRDVVCEDAGRPSAPALGDDAETGSSPSGRFASDEELRSAREINIARQSREGAALQEVARPGENTVVFVHVHSHPHLFPNHPQPQEGICCPLMVLFLGFSMPFVWLFGCCYLSSPSPRVRMLGRASVLLFAVTICTTVIALSHVWERTGKWPWEPKDTP